MTIKEVENLLDIPRATVRFYEKEGLIAPVRTGNSYREYSEADVAKLKKLINFRKLGLSVEDIRNLLSGDVPLQEQLSKNVSDLQEKMKELEGAINICKLMQNQKEDMESFNEDYYWEKIRIEETAGNKFLEIINDVVQFEKNVIFKEFELINDKGEFIYGKREAILRAIGSCIMFGIVWCIMDGGSLEAFIEGFFWPFTCIFIASVLGLPVYFIGKKHPKAAEILKKIGIGISVAFLAISLLILIIIFVEAE